MTSEKPIHTVVLDAGPIIRGEPGISSLLQQCEEIVSTPAVIQEIRDEATRSRLQTTLLPFLQLRTPNPHNVKIITDFARKTGDLSVLSRVDIQLMALSYEIECERNGGDWRLRSTPGQKRTNGPPPAPKETVVTVPETMQNAEGNRMCSEIETVAITESNNTNASDATPISLESSSIQTETMESLSKTNSPSHCQSKENQSTADSASKGETVLASSEESESSIPQEDVPSSDSIFQASEIQEAPSDMSSAQESLNQVEKLSQKLGDTTLSDNTEEGSESSDSEGWITPSNLRKKQVEDIRTNSSSNVAPVHMQVATITGDYAMQNVLLQMNLNLLSPTLRRIKHIKTFILRCHACFNTIKDTSKQFCPRCGKPTLTRVSCTTTSDGEFKLHLKKNMQWNHRGDRFSIPKPVAGASNGKVSGGGKNGWGNGLILAEDQKEYVKGNEESRRVKQRDLMDEDYLPGILTGDRRSGGGKMKVGAGRNVNSKKR